MRHSRTCSEDASSEPDVPNSARPPANFINITGVQGPTPIIIGASGGQTSRSASNFRTMSGMAATATLSAASSMFGTPDVAVTSIAQRQKVVSPPASLGNKPTSDRGAFPKTPADIKTTPSRTHSQLQGLEALNAEALSVGLALRDASLRKVGSSRAESGTSRSEGIDSGHDLHMENSRGYNAGHLSYDYARGAAADSRFSSDKVSKFPSTTSRSKRGGITYRASRERHRSYADLTDPESSSSKERLSRRHGAETNEKPGRRSETVAAKSTTSGEAGVLESTKVSQFTGTQVTLTQQCNTRWRNDDPPEQSVFEKIEGTNYMTAKTPEGAPLRIVSPFATVRQDPQGITLRPSANIASSPAQTRAPDNAMTISARLKLMPDHLGTTANESLSNKTRPIERGKSSGSDTAIAHCLTPLPGLPTLATSTQASQQASPIASPKSSKETLQWKSPLVQDSEGISVTQTLRDTGVSPKLTVRCAEEKTDTAKSRFGSTLTAKPLAFVQDSTQQVVPEKDICLPSERSLEVSKPLPVPSRKQQEASIVEKTAAFWEQHFEDRATSQPLVSSSEQGARPPPQMPGHGHFNTTDVLRVNEAPSRGQSEISATKLIRGNEGTASEQERARNTVPPEQYVSEVKMFSEGADTTPARVPFATPPVTVYDRDIDQRQHQRPRADYDARCIYVDTTWKADSSRASDIADAKQEGPPFATAPKKTELREQILKEKYSTPYQDSTLRLYIGEDMKGLTEAVRSVKAKIEATPPKTGLPLPDSAVTVRSSKGMASLGLLQNEDYDEDALFRRSEDDLLAAQAGIPIDNLILKQRVPGNEELYQTEVERISRRPSENKIEHDISQALKLEQTVPRGGGVPVAKKYHEYPIICSQETSKARATDEEARTVANRQLATDAGLPAKAAQEPETTRRRSIAELIEEIIQQHIQRRQEMASERSFEMARCDARGRPIEFQAGTAPGEIPVYYTSTARPTVHDEYVNNYLNSLVGVPVKSESTAEQAQAEGTSQHERRDGKETFTSSQSRSSRCTIRKLDPGVLTYLVEVSPTGKGQETQSDMMMAEEQVLVSEILDHITAPSIRTSSSGTRLGEQRPPPAIPSQSESLTRIRNTYAEAVAKRILSKNLIGEFDSMFPELEKSKTKASSPTVSITAHRETERNSSTSVPSSEEVIVNTAFVSQTPYNKFVASSADETESQIVAAEASITGTVEIGTTRLGKATPVRTEKMAAVAPEVKIVSPKISEVQPSAPEKPVMEPVEKLNTSRIECCRMCDTELMVEKACQSLLCFGRHDLPCQIFEPSSLVLERFKLRVATDEDIKDIMSISWREGDTPFTGSAAVVTRHMLCPNGFYVVADSKQGHICGTSSILMFDDEVAFCGFFHILEGYMFDGVGVLLWNQMLHTATEKNVFTILPKERSEDLLANYRFHLSAAGTIMVGPVGVSKNLFKKTVLVLEYKDKYFDALASYDKHVFGFQRKRYLAYTLQEVGLEVRVATRNERNISGFGAIQKDKGSRLVLRWLMADDSETAESLLYSLIHACDPEKTVQVVGAFYTRAAATRALLDKVDISGLTPWLLVYNRREPIYNYTKIISLTSI